MGKTLRIAALGLFSIWMSCASAWAQAERVRDVVVQGTQRIDQETVRSYMSIASGDVFSQERLDQSLKSLFSTGLFSDVSVKREGDNLVVRVVENPIINRIAFEGNKRISDELLQAEAQLRPRVAYSRTKVQNDVKRISDLYRRQGRFAATIDPKIIQLDQNRIDLVFEIDEGPATYVQRINFVGNNAFSSARLQEALSTKEERWYRFFSSDDTYDPDRLTYDRELLRKFYLAHGYADFRIIGAVAELTPDRQGFFVTFTIDEGSQYKFGKIGIESALKNLQTGEIEPLLTTASGKTYNADEIERSIQAMTEEVGNRGYAFVDIRPKLNRDPKALTVDVVYDIQEGPRVYVDRIDINGNVRTLDKVIRREFRLAEGDAFNAAKLRRSRQRIRDLNYFEKVEVANVPSETAPDRTTIKVDVEEKSTGELSLGVGWSTSAGPLSEVALRERNLLGKGQDLRVAGTLGTKRTQIDLGFTEPYFLDRPLSAGFDLFAITRKLQNESSYDYDSKGGALRTGFAYNENARQDFKYTLKQDKVENIKSTASRYILDQEGKSTLSSISQTFTYDRRDSRIDPTEGYYARLNNEFAGVGGTETFLRTNVGAGQYFPFGEEVVLGLTGSAGYIFGIGDDVRITERYYLGGETLRGFASAGVSPRDKAGNKDALGGLWMYTGTAQVNFPLGLPKEYGFGGQVFTDFGSVGDTEDSVNASQIDQASSVRAAVGAGVNWRSPMGPISVDLAVPLMKEPFDETELFRFNFGTRF